MLASRRKALAQVVRRPSDRVARFGGEEFALLFPDSDRLIEAADAALYRAKSEGRNRAAAQPSGASA